MKEVLEKLNQEKTVQGKTTQVDTTKAAEEEEKLQGKMIHY